VPVTKEVTYSPAEFREGMEKLLVTAVFAVDNADQTQREQLEKCLKDAAEALEKSSLFSTENEGEVFVRNYKLILTLRYDQTNIEDFYRKHREDANDIIEQAEAFIKAVITEK